MSSDLRPFTEPAFLLVLTLIVGMIALGEKAVLALAGAVWVASRLVRNGSRREAERLVVSAIVAGALLI
jgi:hypothetical protein